MARCLVSFGANMGDPLASIDAGVKLLRSELACRQSDFQLSRFFRTPPVGGPTGQPPFVNAVAAIQTSCSPEQVWHAISAVEQQLGRVRNRRWEARRIDLDILLYDERRIWTAQLKIPHPRMCMRRFILIPASDVAADWIDPVSRCSIAQLSGSLQQGAGNLVLLSPQSSSGEATATQGHGGFVPESWDAVSGEVLRCLAASNLAIVSAERSGSEAHRFPSSTSRWIGTATYGGSQQESLTAKLPATKLVVVLSQPRTAASTTPEGDSAGLAWEQRHRYLAQVLGMTDSHQDDSLSGKNEQAPPAKGGQPQGTAGSSLGYAGLESLKGPRYLLVLDDPKWAAHEIVAALEAMDCPIEPIAS